MKDSKIKNLFNQKITKSDGNVVIPNSFHYIDKSTNHYTKIEMHYYQKDGICFIEEIDSLSLTEENGGIEDKEKLLGELKKKLILEILFDDYLKTLNKYKSILKVLENSEGWFKYDKGAMFLQDKDIDEKDKNFLKEYLSLKE